jgi:hypothetical protein
MVNKVKKYINIRYFISVIICLGILIYIIRNMYNEKIIYDNIKTKIYDEVEIKTISKEIEEKLKREKKIIKEDNKLKNIMNNAVKDMRTIPPNLIKGPLSKYEE